MPQFQVEVTIPTLHYVVDAVNPEHAKNQALLQFVTDHSYDVDATAYQLPDNTLPEAPNTMHTSAAPSSGAGSNL